MSRPTPEDQRRRTPGRARAPHHISSIAHLFFAEDGGDPRPDGGRRPVELAVAGFAPGQPTAYACAGLVAGSRDLLGDAGSGRVALTEEAALTWTAAAYLAAPPGVDHDGTYPRSMRAPAAPPAAGAAPAPAVRWTHLGPLTPAALQALEARGGAAAAVPAGWGEVPGPPGRDGLVLCLQHDEVGRWRTAFRLGRLLGAMRPTRLEILLFAPARGPRGTAPAASDGADPAAWCRERALALGHVERVVVTACPPLGPAAGSAGAGDLLHGVAARILADFGVDRDSR